MVKYLCEGKQVNNKLARTSNDEAFYVPYCRWDGQTYLSDESSRARMATPRQQLLLHETGTTYRYTTPKSIQYLVLYQFKMAFCIKRFFLFSSYDCSIFNPTKSHVSPGTSAIFSLVLMYYKILFSSLQQSCF